MASRIKPDDRAGAPDPRRALRGRRSRPTRPSSSTGRCSSIDALQARSVPQALPASTSRRRPTTRPGAWPRRSPSCARPTRRSSQLLRGLPARGDARGARPARQRAVDPEPLPRGGEPLRRQDLRDDRGFAALKAKIETSRRRRRSRSSTRASARIRRRRPSRLARTFGWAAQVLGHPQCPALYVRSDVPGALVAVANEPPASVAGQTVLTGFSRRSCSFIVGKHLAMYRGEHYIKTLFPTVTELTVLLFAGIKLVAPDTPSPPTSRSRSSPPRRRSAGSCSPCSSRACGWW